MNNIKCFTIFILLCSAVQAQELKPNLSAQIPLTRFPFKVFSGGVIVIKAVFGNVPDSLNFILDTGSGGISLDSATCTDHSIPTRQTDTIITGIGGIRKVDFVFDKTLHLPGLSVPHLNFHVNNYQILTSVYGEKIDGIIGFNFLRRYIVQADFDLMEIRVYSPVHFKYPQGGFILHPQLTFIPVVQMTIRDRKRMNFNFYFDTGAGLCFLMSERFAADSSVLLSRRKPVLTQAEGMLGRLEMRLTVVREVKIGPYKFKKVPTYLYQDNYNVTSYPFTGGLVGNELLRRFNLTLNYAKREIHLLPNTHFDDPFDYAYTGLGIYDIDGKIQVLDVIENSPAEKAGLQVDDEVVGVANNVSRNIQQYKNLLQVTNQSIKVIVLRKGKLLELSLRPESIL